MFTDPSTRVMIDQFYSGVEICPHCGEPAIKPDVKHSDPKHALFFNVRGISIDFEKNTITVAHKSCGKRFNLRNWKLL